MLNRKLAIAKTAAALIGFFGLVCSGWAATTTGSVTVTATVSKSCTISSPTVAFGSYDGVVGNATIDLNGTASFTVYCTTGTPGVSIALGGGSNGTLAQRKMKDTGGALLNYNIYLPDTTNLNSCTSLSTEWGDGSTGQTLTTTTAFTSASQTFNLCGVIPHGQNVEAGNYSDTLTATLTF